jgi:polyribonucleotide nucleotidyltransferase
METKNYTLELGGRDLIVQIRNLAEKANGEVLVKYGDTLVLATCVMANSESAETDFFPLSVNYEERYYAVGKIKGPRYMKREGKPSDEAILSSRLIDRVIRPLFPNNLYREVQVITTCLAWDGENNPDMVSLIAASIALSISDIPWSGPIGAVRIGKINDDFILNPTSEQKEESKIELVLAGIKKNEEVLINMIECRADEADEETILKATEFGEEYIKKLIDFQKEISTQLGKEKILIEGLKDEKLEKEIEHWLSDKLEKSLYSTVDSLKENRINKLKEEMISFVKEKNEEPEKIRFANEIFYKEIESLVHKNAIEQEKRVDGRKPDELRKLDAEVGLIPRSHGCGLFIRGQTKALSILTLGSPGDQQLLEGMETVGKKRFMHHYNFPPYCSGEVKPIRSPGRREIGHGMLAEKALFPLIPSFDDFPYTIRIVSEILCSNGSSSMASICSSSLALMDAGVPIKRPAAGIALGLMSNEKGNYKILTDIQGPEDHHGDMDLKVAGTKEGITAIQMDVKINGINKQILAEALSRGKLARLEILKKIQEVLPAPRNNLSPWAPRVYVLQINPEKIGDVIGPGGKIIRKITEEYEVNIDIEEDGKIFITAEKEENGKKAMTLIKNMTREVKIGEIFEGKCKKVMEFGVFVEIFPGQEGLIHVSKLRRKVLKAGDSVSVKVSNVDEQGRVDLSLNKP